MTEYQHELCYQIQLILIKAISNMDHEEMWKVIEKVVKEYVVNENKA